MPDFCIVIDRCRPNCLLPARDTGAGKGLAVFFRLLRHACRGLRGRAPATQGRLATASMRLIIYVECPPPFQQFCLTPQSASSQRANRQLWLPGRRGPAPILPLRQSHGRGPRRPRLIVDTYREFLIYLQRQARQRGAPTSCPSPEKKTELPIPGRRGRRTAVRRKRRAIAASRLCHKICLCRPSISPAFAVRQRCRTKSSKRLGLRRNKKSAMLQPARLARPRRVSQRAFARARRRIELPKNFSSLSGPGQFRGPEKHS